MKYLILGINGMAGNMIADYLTSVGHEVIGIARVNSKKFKTTIGDVTNINIIKNVLDKTEPDFIVNCVGLLNAYAEENKTQAIFINAELPHILSSMLEGTSTKIFHLSTDCVFSGKTGGYSENDYADGDTFYAKTKSLGEVANNNCLTIRTSIIGPDINEKGIGLFNWFMQRNGDIQGFINVIWTGITTLELARFIEQTGSNFKGGLLNLVPSDSISKYELLSLLNLRFRSGAVNIIPVNSEKPSNKSLKRTNWNHDFIVQDYRPMVDELYDWLQVHKAEFPHYL